MPTQIRKLLVFTVFAMFAFAGSAAAKDIVGSNARRTSERHRRPRRHQRPGRARPILGLGGNDTLTGDTGPDGIEGGAGDDAMDGGTGDDRLDGDDGNDKGVGGFGHDTLLGGPGDDTLRATRRPTPSTAAMATTRCSAAAEATTSSAATATTSIHSDTGPDRIDAGPGDDQIHLNSDPPSAISSINCGEGNDTVYNSPRPGPHEPQPARAQPNCETVIDLAAEPDPTRGITWSGNGTKHGTDRNDRLIGQPAPTSSTATAATT